MQQHRNQPHISPTSAATPASSFEFRQPAKKRGNYNCGRCGLPKKGHVCHLPNNSAAAAATPSSSSSAATTSSAVRPPLSSSRQQQPSHLRRALSFDDVDIRCNSPLQEPEMDDPHFQMCETEEDLAGISGGLPAGCLWEVLRRLPPAGLLAAARVCKGWREATRRLWRAAEQLRLRVPARSQIGFVNSVLQKCPGLVRLNLRMERLGSI